MREFQYQMQGRITFEDADLTESSTTESVRRYIRESQLDNAVAETAKIEVKEIEPGARPPALALTST